MGRTLFLLALGVAHSVAPSVAAASSVPVDASHSLSRAQVAGAFGKLPIRFEKNEGQTDTRVRFLSRGSGYGLFLTSTELVLSLQRSDLEADVRRHHRQGPRAPLETRRPSAVRMIFVGSDAKSEITGVDEQRGRSNYFLGNDRTKWRTEVTQYASVRYRGLWKGVDLLVYGASQGQLETDFIVSPGATPSAIRLAFQGARRVRLNGRGDLVLETEGGEVVQRRPVVYQEVAGERRTVDGSWLLKGRNTVAFRVAEFDETQPLVIDPVIVYSTYLGGTSGTTGHGIALDLAGNTYVTGYVVAAGFPPAGVPVQPGYGGNWDAFVAKLDPASNLIYSTYLGGSSLDEGLAIALDTQGNVTVAGYTRSTDFPTAGAPSQPHIGGAEDAFVAKLSPTSALIYATYLGGSGGDEAYGIAVDAAGNTYVSGETTSTDFPIAGTPLQSQHAGGGWDAFVAKLGPSSALVYSTYLGGSGEDEARGVAVDATGNAYVTGVTNSGDFPMAGTPSQPHRAGSYDAFVAELSPDSSLVYSTYLGGTGNDMAYGIAVGLGGSAFVTGWTDSDNFPIAGVASQPQYGGGYGDAFVARLDPTSNLVYSTYLGGSSLDYGYGIAVDPADNAHIAGETYSGDFPTTGTPFQPTFGGGGGDAFIADLGPTSSLLYSTYLGGSLSDAGYAIAVNPAGHTAVTGYTISADFPTAGTPSEPHYGGNGNAFVASFGPTSTIPSTPIIFVHGWCGTATDWEGLVGSLQAAYPGRYGNPGDVATLWYDYPREKVVQEPDDGPHPIYLLKLTPSCQESSCGSPIDGVDLANTSIREKAFQLKHAVAKAVNASSQVIVIGHSQGGLVGRAYVENLACEMRGNLSESCMSGFAAPYAGDVAEVITVDTPNAGSAWASVPLPPFLCQAKDTFSKREMTRQPLSASLSSLNSANPLGVRVTSVSSYLSTLPNNDGVVDYDSQSLKSILFENYMDARNVANIDNPVAGVGCSWSDPLSCSVHSLVLEQPETASLINSLIQSRPPELEVTDFVATPSQLPPWQRGMQAPVVDVSFKVNLLTTASHGPVLFRYSPHGKVAVTTNGECPGCGHFDAGVGPASKTYSLQMFDSSPRVVRSGAWLDQPVGALLVGSRVAPPPSDKASSALTAVHAVRPTPRLPLLSPTNGVSTHADDDRAPDEPPAEREGPLERRSATGVAVDREAGANAEGRYVAVQPCRISYARQAGDPVATLQIAGRCGIPGQAHTVAASVTATGSAAGFVSLSPTHVAQPKTLLLDFEVGQAQANATFLQLGKDGALDVSVVGDVSIHLVIEVNGYFE